MSFVKSLLASFTLLFQLVSPFFSQNIDYSSRLKVPEEIPPSLDYSQSTPLSSLEAIPSYIIYNLDTGEVYAASGSSRIISPASFTKLITAQTVIDLLPLTSLVTVQSDWLGQPPTILDLKAGEQFSLSELLRASIATSANDAASVLAYGSASLLGVSNQEFINLVNKKAQINNMGSSQFVTPSGLDADGQQTTIEDLTKLVFTTIKSYPDIVFAAQSDMEDIEASQYHGHYYLPNWNGLLGVYPHVVGLKIAYTETAGYSTIVTYSYNNLNLVAIVSGADSLIERDVAAANLLDAGLIANHQSPTKISTQKIRQHYQVWNQLSAKIKAELKAKGLLKD